MHIRKTTCLAAVACTLFATSAAAQCHLPAAPLAKRIEQSIVIAEGTVIAQKSFWDEAHRVIYTASSIAVRAWYKNGLPADTIEFITPGGQVDNDLLKVSGALELRPGDNGIFLTSIPAPAAINRNRSGKQQYFASHGIYSFLPVHSASQSVLDEGKTIQLSAFTSLARGITGQQKKTVLAKNNAADVQQNILSAITLFSPATVTAGTGTTITITGAGFGNTPGTVFFRNSNTGGGNFIGTSPNHIVSWDDNTIVTQVPTGAGTGTFFIQDALAVNSPLTATPLSVTYNITNVTQGDGTIHRTYLIDDGANGDGGYHFLFSNNTANNGEDFTANAAAMQRIAEAAGRWVSSVSYPLYAQGCAGTTAMQTPGPDGTNIISFDSDAWDLDVQSGNSTLAVAYSYYSRCSGGGNWELVDMDIIFRRNGNPNGTGGAVNWNFSDAAPLAGQTDFLSVAIHEIGHTLQLGHIISPGSVMHYAIAAGTMSRTLSAGSDIAGGQDVMNISKAYNPPLLPCGGDFSQPRQAADYIASADCNVLVIQLASFSARAEMNHAILEWEATSSAGDQFILQRSADGYSYQNIATMDARNGSAAYNWTDKNLLPGLYYYRLALANNDGTIKYSSIEKITVRNSNKAWIVTQGSRQLQVYLPYYGVTTATEALLLNAGGQQVSRFRLIPGVQTTIDMSPYPPGTYFLHSIINSKTVTEKITIAH